MFSFDRKNAPRFVRRGGWSGESENFLVAGEFFYILTSHARCYIISLTMLRIFYWGKYARDKEFVEKV